MKKFKNGKHVMPQAQTQAQQLAAASMASTAQATLLANPMASLTDPYGSYTGVPLLGDKPIQDADDL